jgi:hypothetical protein
MTGAAPFSHFMTSIVSDKRLDSLISQKRLTGVLLDAILTATSMIVMLRPLLSVLWAPFCAMRGDTLVGRRT